MSQAADHKTKYQTRKQTNKATRVFSLQKASITFVLRYVGIFVRLLLVFARSYVFFVRFVVFVCFCWFCQLLCFFVRSLVCLFVFVCLFQLNKNKHDTQATNQASNQTSNQTDDQANNTTKPKETTKHANKRLRKNQSPA